MAPCIHTIQYNEHAIYALRFTRRTVTWCEASTVACVGAVCLVCRIVV
jgi:hypothetical protein